MDSAPIFLTVGTTRFDALVQAADDVAFAAAAEARGYTSLTIQARSPAAKRVRHAACVAWVGCITIAMSALCGYS